jgi:hypothetical protein
MTAHDASRQDLVRRYVLALRFGEQLDMEGVVERVLDLYEADLREQVRALQSKTPKRVFAPLTYGQGRDDGGRKALDDVLALLKGDPTP